MKRFVMCFCIIIYSVLNMNLITCAMETKAYSITSGDETNSNSQKKEPNSSQNSGDYSNHKLSEEGASVDSSITDKNYNVELPTIILLVLFGILVIISFILFALKI